MKLLFVIKALGAGVGGGAERILTTIATALADRRHDVSVLTYDTPDTEDFYHVGANVRRIRLGIGRTVAKSGPLVTLARLRRTRMVARDLTPDVAVGFMHSSFIPLALALAGTGTPVVGSERTSYRHYRLHPLQNALIHLFLPILARMTVNAEGVRQGFPAAIKRRMTVLPNPVAAVQAVADPAGGLAKTLLSVGGLRPEKDHETLIRAFAGISAAHPDWRLRIVGDGALQSQLEVLAQQLGASGRIDFAGSTRTVEKEYARAQLFVLPSLYEAFPNCLTEALAHGLPAVGFADCPGTNELIQHEVNGVLVTGLNRVNALADVLHDLFGSAEKRSRLGQAAAPSVARYSLDRVVDRWEMLLRSVAESAAFEG